MKKKVLFLLSNRKTDSYGITSGLYNSAKFASSFLNSQGYDSILRSVIDSNQIDKIVTELDPQVVIVEAIWVPPAKFEELFKFPRHQKRTWIVRIHSKAPFLANEGIVTEWIRKYTSIQSGKIIIAPNTLELTKQFCGVFPEGKFLHLPNIYQAEKVVSCHVRKKKCIDIGCFGAIRPMKNQYQQALAAIEFANKEGKQLRFHINSTRMEQGGEKVSKNIRALFENSPHKLIEHVWYNHANFLKALSKMDIGMQVSFSESFNIVTADMVTANVPVVASNDIDWMPWFLKVSPNSHREMVKKLRFVSRRKMITRWFQKLFLNLYNFKAKLIWLASLKEIG